MELIDKGIAHIFALGALVRDSGFSTGLLWLAGVLFLLSFVISAREFLAWYLKTNRVLSEVAELREAVRSLRASVAELRSGGDVDARPGHASPMSVDAGSSVKAPIAAESAPLKKRDAIAPDIESLSATVTEPLPTTSAQPIRKRFSTKRPSDDKTFPLQ